eukprot:CAMPEP_0197521986 /NCGR_PEP_ID=MMETSP1318-20131121/7187_1 /TAXON_ID=552666 /ORGANISM="Partenskyella glossopodia, Strain RCC365" /LENGTH=656 /DNA_ID=CAMNT_0043074177 /DNA_START=356 /DNA_END=2326 /DNA_ORIENTATION=-
MKSESNSRIRVILSTNFRDISISALHVQLPLGFVKRETWLNVCIDLNSIMEGTFKTKFRSLETLEIRSYCKIRRIFTMRSPLDDDTEDSELYNWSQKDTPTGMVPRVHNYPVGVTHQTQIYSMDKVHAYLNIRTASGKTKKGGSGRRSRMPAHPSAPKTRRRPSKRTPPLAGRRYRMIPPASQEMKDISPPSLGSRVGSRKSSFDSPNNPPRLTSRTSVSKPVGLASSVPSGRADLEPATGSPFQVKGGTMRRRRSSLKRPLLKPLKNNVVPEASASAQGEMAVAEEKRGHTLGPIRGLKKDLSFPSASSRSERKETFANEGKGQRKEGNNASVISLASSNQQLETLQKPSSEKENGHSSGANGHSSGATKKPFPTNIRLETLELESARPKDDGCDEANLGRGDVEVSSMEEDAKISEDWEVNSAAGKDAVDMETSAWQVTTVGVDEEVCVPVQLQPEPQPEPSAEKGKEKKQNRSSENSSSENNMAVSKEVEQRSIHKEAEEDDQIQNDSFKFDGNEASHSQDYGHVVHTPSVSTPLANSRPGTSSSTWFANLSQLHFGSDADRLMTPPLHMGRGEEDDDYGYLHDPHHDDGRCNNNKIDVEPRQHQTPYNNRNQHRENMKRNNNNNNMVKLLYDPILECYYDPSSNQYFHFDTS